MTYQFFLFIFLMTSFNQTVQASTQSNDPITKTGPAQLPWEKPSPKTSTEVKLDLLYKSIETNFPLTEVAKKQVELAEGRALASQGAFDLRLNMQAGFLTESYDQQLAETSLTQQIPGTPLEIYGGWRRGQGYFRDYEGKSLTGSDGEYRGGLKIPLLRNFISDSFRNRLATSKATLLSEKETLQFRILELKRLASDRYWDWIGSYFKLEATYKLYELAHERYSQINRRVKAGSSAQFEITEVERMIAQRKSQLIEAERAYQKSSLDLSLYYRDNTGHPYDSISMAKNFDLISTLSSPSVDLENTDKIVSNSLSTRNDLKALDKQEEAADYEATFSKNQLLPRLDAQIEYAVDKGSPKDGEKELRGSLTLTFPLQNREAKGNLASAQARIEQIRLSKRFLNEQIKQDILNLRSALLASHGKAKALLSDRELSEKLAQAERKRFQDGLSSLLFVNLREQSANDSSIKAMDAIIDYQKIKVLYKISQGNDPALQ